MSFAIGDKIGCLTVVELIEAAQARERNLLGYRGRPAVQQGGAHVLVRCDCLLEFIVRARGLSRRKKATRCGKRCELGKRGKDLREQEWTHCRNPLCAGSLRPNNRSGFCSKCWDVFPGKRWAQMSRPDWPKAKARRNKLNNARRQARSDAGICPQCGNPTAPGKAYCEKDAKYKVQQNKDRRQARRLAGQCIWCGVDAHGERYCAEHHEVMRKKGTASHLARMRLRRDAGLCLGCPATRVLPAVQGRRMCAEHLIKTAAYKREYAQRNGKHETGRVAA